MTDKAIRDAINRGIDKTVTELAELWNGQDVAKERERCAKIVETYGLDNVATYNLVMMIRNPRGGSGSGPEEVR